MSDILLKADKISKKYGEQVIFSNLSFTVNSGETFAIIGYSGCGKTTLLRIVGGFEQPDCGSISIKGKKISCPSKDALMVFQDFSQLFPWRTLIDNIVWAMMATGIEENKTEALKIAKTYLTDMKIGSADHRKYPFQCSGGMKQRAALARALSLRPKVLLMDEPFASLDYLTRRRMQNITKEAVDRYKLTVVWVTHSISEVLYMADKILVFDGEGKISIIENNSDAERNIGNLLKIDKNQ